MIFDILLDSVLDCARLVPFLFVTYLVMEYLEHKTGEHTTKLIRKAGKLGPVWGGILGVVPQCGFSAAASSLYAGRLITVGTLLAIYLSTSDEMLPILLSEQVDPQLILKILGIKVALAVVTGLCIDQVLLRIFRRPAEEIDIHSICEHEHCRCGEKSILRSALNHTVHIVLYIFLISIVLNLAIEAIGRENLSGLILNVPVAGQMLAALVGMIPNCAASVIITQLYVEGILNGGAMMAGLLANAGVGVLILFRMHRNVKKNLQIVGMLYGAGVIWGLLIQMSGIL
ncbi:MAG: putative manganese transporter [Lachnospiraceae bacterium]|nr:putative manganese transporter [Lachnospiraceae bacterium]